MLLARYHHHHNSHLIERLLAGDRSAWIMLVLILAALAGVGVLKLWLGQSARSCRLR